MSSFGDMTDLVLTAARLRPDTDREAVKRSINDAYLDVANQLDLNQTSKTVTLSAGKNDYDVVGDFGITDLLSINYIVGPSTGVILSDPLLEATYPSRLLAYRDTQSAIQPLGPAMYALYGDKTLMFYPTPTSSDGVTIYYVFEPEPLFADSDEPDALPRGLHRLIEDRAIEFAARWARNLQLSADAHSRFTLGLGEARVWLDAREGGSTSVRTASNVRGYRFVPHDRSTDRGF